MVPGWSPLVTDGPTRSRVDSVARTRHCPRLTVPGDGLPRAYRRQEPPAFRVDLVGRRPDELITEFSQPQLGRSNLMRGRG